MLQSKGPQRVGHNWATELNETAYAHCLLTDFPSSSMASCSKSVVTPRTDSSFCKCSSDYHIHLLKNLSISHHSECKHNRHPFLPLLLFLSWFYFLHFLVWPAWITQHSQCKPYCPISQICFLFYTLLLQSGLPSHTLLHLWLCIHSYFPKTWRRAWQPTWAFLLGEFHEPRNLAGCSPRDHKEVDMTAVTTTPQNQNPSSGGQLLFNSISATYTCCIHLTRL